MSLATLKRLIEIGYFSERAVTFFLREAVEIQVRFLRSCVNLRLHTSLRAVDPETVIFTILGAEDGI